MGDELEQKPAERNPYGMAEKPAEGISTLSISSSSAEAGSKSSASQFGSIVIHQTRPDQLLPFTHYADDEFIKNKSTIQGIVRNETYELEPQIAVLNYNPGDGSQKFNAANCKLSGTILGGSSGAISFSYTSISETDGPSDKATEKLLKEDAVREATKKTIAALPSIVPKDK